MYNIFLVEDDKNISSLLKSYLENEGYYVSVYSSEKSALEHLDNEAHLYLLDIMLESDMSGYNILKEIRKRGNTPAIFISARDKDYDKILGFEMGADDYVAKPFSPREVVLRVNNIIKRTYSKTEMKSTYKSYTVDLESRQVLGNGVTIELTTKEFELFIYLLKNRNIALSREKILENVWEENYYGSDRVVDDLMRRLRGKLVDADIETIYGYGYKLK
ncbi:MAG: response regulator transcription factor [Clostridia bacterium]|nr:response regulator transcription factor [Clostridia bacterium]MBR2069887.1 response regulator transcription factor [Clostridia bacterium]